MTALVIAIAALWVGPVFGHTLRQTSVLHRAETLLSWVIVLLALGALLPHSLEEGGWLSLVFFAVAALLPSLFEALVRVGSRRSHRATATLVLAGLVLHALMDGAAIEVGDGADTAWLPWVIVAHRLPVGLAVWMVATKVWGHRATIVALLSMSVATVVGALMSANALPWADAEMIAWFEAAIAGGLLHALGHRSTKRRERTD